MQGAERLTLLPAGKIVAKCLELHQPGRDSGSKRTFGEFDETKPDDWPPSKLCLAFRHTCEHWQDKVSARAVRVALQLELPSDGQGAKEEFMRWVRACVAPDSDGIA